MENNNKKEIHNIIISMGDPAGIGSEVILKALGQHQFPDGLNPIIVGCKKTLDITYLRLKEKGINLIDPSKLTIKDYPLNCKISPGKPNAKTGDISFKWLTYATELILSGKGKALVTAPITKHAWQEAGHQYPGQTERLGEITSVKEPSMLFTAISPNNNWRFNTLLTTTHIPLSKVCEYLTPNLIVRKLDALVDFCKIFNKRPKIKIAGINPHSGEQGKIGTEEINWLIPTIKKWEYNHPDVIIEGPCSPDTCWISAAKAWNSKENKNYPNGFLALYHDQGLIPVKIIAFDSAVNTTLGLPFIRTSPDHGTACDIAGKGDANPESMIAAIQTAWDLSKTQS